MARLKSKKAKNTLLIKKKSFRRVNYKKSFYLFPNIKCSTTVALIAKNNYLLRKKQMDLYLFKLNKLLKNSLINIYSSIVFNKTFTQKPKQARMGKGKAEVVDLIGTVSKFDPIFEFSFNIKEKKKKKKKCVNY